MDKKGGNTRKSHPPVGPEHYSPFIERHIRYRARRAVAQLVGWEYVGYVFGGIKEEGE